MDSFQSKLVSAFSDLLAPLADASADTSGLESLLSELGYGLPAELNGVPVFAGMSSLVDHLDDLDDLLSVEDVDEQQLALSSAAVAKDILVVIAGFRAVETWLRSEFDNVPDFVNTSRLSELPRRLVDYLVVTYVEEQFPTTHAILEVIGLLEAIPVEADPEVFQIAHTAHVIHWERMEYFVTNMARVFREAYGSGAKFDMSLLLERIQNVGINLGIPVDLDHPHKDLLARFNPGRVSGDEELALVVPFLVRSDIGLEVGFEICPLYSDAGSINGIALVLFVDSDPTLKEFTLSDELVLEISSSLDLDAGLGLVARRGASGGMSIEFAANLYSENPIDIGDLNVQMSFRSRSPADQLTMFFGDESSSHLGVGGYGAQLFLGESGANREVAVEVSFERFTLNVTSDQADGFLQEILSGINIHSSCDLILGYSSLDGFYFRGSGSLEIEIPIHETIGPIHLDTLFIGFGIYDGYEIKLAASFGAELGPVSVGVSKIGLRFTLSFPSNQDGNLGPLQIEAPTFMPPTGVGLAVDASGIAGGGVIDFDPDNERYAGMLGLNFGEIGLTAIGLITTRMPDGSDGFAMLVVIGVTFSPPIQLSMGFTLSGVGGLLGINRSMNIEYLQKGIRNRTLDPILFPEISTFIQNASTNFSILRGAFPPVDGRYIVGPMVKIGWGSPNIITADIGIFLEFPAPIRIVLMGQVEATYPNPENPVVIIHLDLLGVVDIEKQELTFQASLYDSWIQKFALSGDSAFLLGWGQDRRLALSLGGFHPKFTPPPPPIVFADLKRLSLSISSGPDFQLAGTAYQALTPNSLQFGSWVLLYAKKGKATVTGQLGFDTLIYFSPFSFEVTISAGVRIKYKGKSLAEIDLSMVLSGPTPWNARGRAKIKILGVSIKVRFNFTWGRSEAVLLESVDPWPELKNALDNPGNWASTLPPGRSMVALLRSFEDEGTDQIVVHPSGRLEVKQNVVPLGVKLALFGNAPVAGHDLFNIESLTSDAELFDLQPVQEFFARGQFEQLSADQRLSLPAFEKMPGGVAATTGAVRIDGEVESKALGYESILIKPDRTSEPPKPGGIAWDEAQYIARASEAQRWALRAGPRKRFSTADVQPQVGVPEEELYCIANAADLTRADFDPEIAKENRNLTRMVADQELKAQQTLLPDRPDELIVIPEYEVAT
jgi:hypothetical protein